MKKAKTYTNVLFAVVFVFIICSFLISKGIVALGVSLPDAMGVGRTESSLEGRKYTEEVAVSTDAFLNKTLQDQVESWASDGVPNRDMLLMTSADIQRRVIALSASIMGYDTYHTYFGSDVVLNTSYGYLSNVPYKAGTQFIKKCEQYSKSIDDLAGSHPNVNTYVFVAPHSSAIDDSPVTKLVTKPATSSIFKERYLDRLTNARAIDSSKSFKDYLEESSKTDHHWNSKGAYEAYSRIVTALGFDPWVPSGGDYVTYEEPLFYGSYARTGRCADLDDHVDNYRLNMDGLHVTMDGKEVTTEDLCHQQTYDQGKWESERFYNRYSEFYHGDHGEICIESQDSESDKTLLIVGDSFSNSMERYFSKHYKKTLVYDMRYNAMKLDEYIGANPEINDVVFIMWQGNYLSKEFASVMNIS